MKKRKNANYQELRCQQECIKKTALFTKISTNQTKLQLRKRRMMCLTPRRGRLSTRLGRLARPAASLLKQILWQYSCRTRKSRVRGGGNVSDYDRNEEWQARESEKIREWTNRGNGGTSRVKEVYIIAPEPALLLIWWGWDRPKQNVDKK